MPAYSITPPPRWHEQTASLDNALHADCHLPGTFEAKIHPWRVYFSSVRPSKLSIGPQVGYNAEPQSCQDPGEDEHADELPWDSFWLFVQKFWQFVQYHGRPSYFKAKTMV
jgi:hypothetical protein